MEILIPQDGESIIDEYSRLWEEFTTKFGEKVIIFMQVGGFYEVYQWTERINGKTVKIGNSDFASELYGWIIGRKSMAGKKHANAKVGSKYIPYMTGCPDHRFNGSNDFYVTKALNEGYHVVIVDQIGKNSQPGEKRCRRVVRCVRSPGTSLDYVGGNDHFQSSYLICLYVENQNLHSDYLSDCMLCIGMAAFDVTTGQTFVHETYSSYGDMTLPLDEAYRFVNSYSPKELLLTTKNLTPELTADFVSCLELENYNLSVKELETEFNKQAYKEAILDKVFPNRPGLLGVIDYLGMSCSPGILTAYTTGIQWTYEHDHDLIKDLIKPVIWDSTKHLTLTYNAIHQLHVVPSHNAIKVRRNVNSLYAILNKAKTALGKRLMQDRMLSPITCPEELKKRYKFVKTCLNCHKQIQKILTNVKDIERLYRRVCLKRIRPLELGLFIESLGHIVPVYEFVKNKQNLQPMLPDDTHWSNFLALIERCKVFDLALLKNTQQANAAEVSFFKPGFDSQIDELVASLAKKKVFIDTFAHKLVEIVEGPAINRKSSRKFKPPVEMETDKQGQCFLRTKLWAAKALKQLHIETTTKPETEWKEAASLFPDQVQIVQGLEFEMQKNSAKIRSINIRDYSSQIGKQQEKLTKQIFKTFTRLMEEFESNFYQTMQIMNRFISEIDLTLGLAQVARENKYCEPKVIEAQASFVAVKDIRHPIIEQVHPNELYIPNDLVIGQVPDNNNYLRNFADNTPRTKNGLLLFSVNGAGKSSLMKAVGLNVIMAQMGGFVACSEFVFSPFTNIITRISGDDNMFKGQSSFAVEMSEVRTMLRRAGPKTLVLGDEVCRGTNIKDAIGLVAAVIQKLAERETNFVFASHYHAITEFKTIQSLENVEFYHLTVEIGNARRGNENVQDIIYERKLQEGVGQVNYGIQVAMAQGIDKEVIQAARRYALEFEGIVDDKLVPTKTSRYNRLVFMIECNRCGARASNKVRLATHHIKEQHTADDNGFIDHWGKNRAHNLEILCESCHQEHHHHIKNKSRQKTCIK